MVKLFNIHRKVIIVWVFYYGFYFVLNFLFLICYQRVFVILYFFPKCFFFVQLNQLLLVEYLKKKKDNDKCYGIVFCMKVNCNPKWLFNLPSSVWLNSKSEINTFHMNTKNSCMKLIAKVKNQGYLSFDIVSFMKGKFCFR